MNETNRVVTELVVDGSQAVAGAGALESAFARAGAPVDQLQSKIDAVMSQQLRMAGNVPQSIERVTVAYQKLQASTDPVLKAQFAMEREMTRSMAVINRAVLLGVTTEEQAAATIAALRNRQIADLNRVREATAKAVPVAANQNRLSANQLQGLGYQANDIVTMALLGASPGQIAFSQGGQILQNLQMNEGGIMGSLRGIKTGAGEAMAAVTAFLGPVGLIATGFGAAAVAAGAFFLATREHTKTIDEALKEYESRVRDIGDAYGYAARQAKSMPGVDFRTGDLLSAMSRNDLKLALTNNTRDLMGDLLLNQGGGQGRGGVNSGTAAQIVQPEFATFANAIDHLRITAKQDTPDIAGFRDMVTKDWSLDPLNESLTKAASKLLDMTDSAMKAVEALKQIERAQKAVFDQYQLYSASRLAGPASKAAQDENDARLRADKAGPYGTGIPIPTARPNDIDRLDSDPYAAMSRAMETRVRLAQQEASAVGLSGRALETYRFEMDVLNDALSKNIELTSDQRAEVHKQAEAYAEQKAMQQAAEAARSQIDNLSQLRLEAALIGQNATVRARALAQYGAELEIRKQGIALDSVEAQQQRDLALRIADTTAQIQRQADAWGIISDTAQSGIDRLVDSAANGFKDIKDALNDVAKDLLKTSLQLSVANPLKNWLTGSDLPELGDLKNMGGALGRLFGRSPADPANAVASAVADRTTAMMTVTAAVVNITGAGAFGTPSGFADMLGAAAGDATSGAPLGKVTRAALPDVGSAALKALNDNFPAAGFTKGGIPLVQIGAQGLTAKINAEYASRFQGLLDDLTAAGYPIKSLGEGGYSYRNVAGSTHLSNHAYGNAIDINPSRFGNPMAPGAKGNWAQYGIDPNELAQRNGLFYGGNWRNADTMHFQVDKSAKALDHLATNSIPAVDHSLMDAMNSLKSFGGGLDALGKALAGGASAPGGSLAGLFGSGVTLASMLAISPRATANIASGSWGLFDSGGYTGHGGRMDPAGIVHRGEFVFDAASTARIGIANLEAIRRAPGYADGGPVAMPVSRAAANANSAPNIYTIVNNAPPGTKTRTEVGKDASGRDAYITYVEFGRKAEANGEFDDIRESRTGTKPVRTVRGR